MTSPDNMAGADSPQPGLAQSEQAQAAQAAQAAQPQPEQPQSEAKGVLGLVIAAVAAGAPLAGILIMMAADASDGDFEAGFLGMMLLILSFFANFVLIPLAVFLGMKCWASSSPVTKRQAVVILGLSAVATATWVWSVWVTSSL
nr:hypothetical protein [Corynebacterium lactis]